jgi:hypothetical protein
VEIVELVEAVAAHYGIDVEGLELGVLVGGVAAELRLPGFLPDGDNTPPRSYEGDAGAVRVLEVIAGRVGLVVPDDARCERRGCLGLRVDGAGCYRHPSARVELGEGGE